MIPTKEEYEKAKLIVFNYEQEQRRVWMENVEKFKISLTNYFKNHLVNGHKIEYFELEGNDILIDYEDINFSGNYDGENDDEIEAICKRYNVNFSFPYWYYPK